MLQKKRNIHLIIKNDSDLYSLKLKDYTLPHLSQSSKTNQILPSLEERRSQHRILYFVSNRNVINLSHFNHSNNKNKLFIANFVQGLAKPLGLTLCSLWLFLGKRPYLLFLLSYLRFFRPIYCLFRLLSRQSLLFLRSILSFLRSILSFLHSILSFLCPILSFLRRQESTPCFYSGETTAYNFLLIFNFNNLLGESL